MMLESARCGAREIWLSPTTTPITDSSRGGCLFVAHHDSCDARVCSLVQNVSCSAHRLPSGTMQRHPEAVTAFRFIQPYSPSAPRKCPPGTAGCIRRSSMSYHVQVHKVGSRVSHLQPQWA